MDTCNPIHVPVPESGGDDAYSEDTQRKDKALPLPIFTQPDLDALFQDAECSICLKLLCEPTTLACGHSFCGQCLLNAESRQYMVACALCRTRWSGPCPPPNVVLRAMLQRLFPEEYARRLEEANAEVQSVQDSSRIALATPTRLLPAAPVQHPGPGLFNGIGGMPETWQPESSEIRQTGQDDTSLEMTVHEMRWLMEEEGLPLFAYNTELSSDPKRLMLSQNGATCLLVGYDEEDFLVPNDRVDSFNLHELECIQLGGRCEFARLLNTQNALSPLWSQGLDIMEPGEAFGALSSLNDRLAAFKFRDGTLCLRFLSLTLQTAAINVIRAIRPDCPVEA
eukprot:gnl/MRDRNA2_/MRDRNA2_19443_c0_seq1.p1 gnl/MRDRNA2_/MRDRNA2_19443_c0~~gnl/MRDRNA2_/MRDRNA2_19443_c0_seq1.p1  ORF type:complete len:338 (-),score=61.19 gnl/MRDRNA2_/MRDRNA2_19443_c0_seq1:227-1240(-)